MLFNIVQVSLVTFWCQQKQNMTEGWTDGQTMDEMILTLVTHNNKNHSEWHKMDIVSRSRASRRSRSRRWAIFKWQPWPAAFTAVFGMTALCSLLRILLCFEFVPPPNLLFFTFVFVLPRPPPFFADYEFPSSIFFFRSENFCRTFGPAHWRFLSDILKKCPIVRQVGRISTALFKPSA